jgi:Ca2+-binding RTX toxin-like protein
LSAATFAPGVLTVNGTAAKENIAVTAVGAGTAVQVTLNGQIQLINGTSSSIPLSKVDQVMVFGNGGDDTITITSIDKIVTVDGGMADIKLVIVGDAAANQFAALTDTSLSVNGHAYSFTKLGSGSSLTIAGQGGNDKLSVMTQPAYDVLFNGGGGVNTLVGPSTDNAWNIVTVNGGNLNPATSSFLFGNVQNLTGGTGADTFNIKSGGALSDNIDGGGGTDVLSYSGRSTPVTFNLQTSPAPGSVGFGTAVGGVLNVAKIEGGGSGNDTLVGFNAANTFNITGANTGSVGGIKFSGFENLSGGAFNDSFIFADGAVVTGKISGGLGFDVMDFSAYTSAVSINLQTKLFLAVSAGRFAGIEKFIGSAANTTTLVAPNTINTWRITGANMGSVAGFMFTNITNLTGGNVADTFKFADGTSVTGTVNGGGGTDTLDLSDYTTAITVNLQTNTATAAAPIAKISSIERLIGGMSTSDTLVGTNAGFTWNITAHNAGNVSTTSGTTTTVGLSFKGVENLTGGTGGDTFALANGAGISGKIDGGGGTGLDELKYSAYTTPVTVDLSGQDSASKTGTATNIGGGVSGISDVFGGSADDHLTGDSKDNFLFGGGGNDVLDGMGGNNVLVGGSGNDTLRVTGSSGRNIMIGGLGMDTITGGSGDDILINGTTSFDNNTGTLSSLYTFWTSAANFATAVSQLRAGVSVMGTTIALNSTTVFNDASTDIMTGNGGSNWFLTKQSSPAKDDITDRNVNDLVN